MTHPVEVRQHLHAIRDMTDDPRVGVRAALALSAIRATPLAECPLCGRVGVPERIYGEACPHDSP